MHHARILDTNYIESVHVLEQDYYWNIFDGGNATVKGIVKLMV
jgi:hypothetical protein